MVSQEKHKDIVNFLIKWGIYDYKILSDGSVDVYQEAITFNPQKDFKVILHEIPIQFNKVYGDVYMNQLQLKSLKGFPKWIKGNCRIEHNWLRSLKGCSEYVGGWFVCSNNHLNKLWYGPKYVGGRYDCSENEIDTLKGVPQDFFKYSNEHFLCLYNKLKDLEYLPVTDDVNRVNFASNDDLSREEIDKYWSKCIDLNYKNYYELKGRGILGTHMCMASPELLRKYGYLDAANEHDLG